MLHRIHLILPLGLVVILMAVVALPVLAQAGGVFAALQPTAPPTNTPRATAIPTNTPRVIPTLVPPTATDTATPTSTYTPAPTLVPTNTPTPHANRAGLSADAHAVLSAGLSAEPAAADRDPHGDAAFPLDG